MNLEESKGIIELDDLNLKCVIFKIRNNNIEILATSSIPSEGIHNDVIVNLSKASNAIRSCISSAEKKAKISLKKINVVLEQPDFLCTKFSKHKKINGSKIYKDDIDFLLKEAKKQLLYNDKTQSIIHIFNYNYIVDGKSFIEEPINVYADSLTHQMTFITAPKNNLKNINQAFIDCDIEVERLFSRTFAQGVKLLEEKELHFGSVLLNLDFEKTSLGLFKNLALVHSTTFPFGINHITKDISKVCSLSLSESENIRNNINFLLQENQTIFDENDYLKNSYFVKSNFRKINKNLILNVIQARLNEMINTLRKELIIPELNINHGASFYFSGIGSNLLNIDKYFIKLLRFDINNSKKNNIDKDKNFVPCLGAAKIIAEGWETEAIPESTSKNEEKVSLFTKIFGMYK